jgi:Leucine-rich repeat (LRR) protein
MQRLGYELRICWISLGSTHVLLASLSNPLAMSSLMDVLLPIIEDTLVVLDIHANMLREFPDALSRCRALEELNISENPISAVPKWLGHLTELRVVLLDRCSLRTLPVNMIAAQHLHTICSKLMPPLLSASSVPLTTIYEYSTA